jgi:hypothetical protein
MIDKNKFEILELEKYKLGPEQIVNTYGKEFIYYRIP